MNWYEKETKQEPKELNLMKIILNDSENELLNTVVLLTKYYMYKCFLINETPKTKFVIDYILEIEKTIHSHLSPTRIKIISLSLRISKYQLHSKNIGIKLVCDPNKILLSMMHYLIILFIIWNYFFNKNRSFIVC